MSRKKKKAEHAGPRRQPDSSGCVAAAQPGILSGQGRILFLGLLVVGAFFRLLWLGKASLQIDEINVVRFALDAKGLGDIYATELERFTAMHRLPTLMMLIKLAITLVPHEGYPPEWISRLPMALLGIASLPFFYLLGRRVVNPAVGLWAMLLATFSTFHCFYSREAYDYAIVIFFSAGTLWASMELAQAVANNERHLWRRAIICAVCSTGLLYAHLSCLLFIAPWFALVGLWLLAHVRSRVFSNNVLPSLLAVFVLPFILFLPFLLELGGGFVNADDVLAQRFSLSVFPSLWGRMGWGESLTALVPFSLVSLVGVLVLVRNRSGIDQPGLRRVSLPALLVLQLVIYIVLQSWMLRVSRFETRYYSPMFPLLILLAAVGIEYLIARLSAARVRMARIVAATVIAAAATPSLWAVCQLDARGYNYKGMARWLMTHLPEGGVYAFYNIYELRGVPAVYPTPGRIATSVAFWSSDEDFVRANPPARMQSMFSRFPRIVFVEIPPEDLFNEHMRTDQIDRRLDRETPFMRHEWLEDPAADRLFRWRTHPMGETQWNNRHLHRTYFSYNLPSDLPALARKKGQSLYHDFGAGWQYVNDGAFNHWMAARDTAYLTIGNLGDQPVEARLRLKVYAPPPGCRLRVYGIDQKLLGDAGVGAEGMQDVRVDGLDLPVGQSELRLIVTPLKPGTPTPLLVYEASLEPVVVTEAVP